MFQLYEGRSDICKATLKDGTELDLEVDFEGLHVSPKLGFADKLNTTKSPHCTHGVLLSLDSYIGGYLFVRRWRDD